MLHLIEGAFPYFALPLVISLQCVPIAKRIGFALNVYAVENSRNVHHGKIVRIGGLAMFTAFMISMACFMKADATWVVCWMTCTIWRHGRSCCFRLPAR